MNTDSRRMEEKSLFSIECKDVFLREWIPSDLDRFHSLTWQPEIYEFLPGWNVSKKQRQDWLTHYEIPENKKFLGAVSEGGNVGDLRLRLGIVWKESGELIGWCCTGMKEYCLRRTGKSYMRSRKITGERDMRHKPFKDWSPIYSKKRTSMS